MIKSIHHLCGLTALLLISCFWLSTVVAESILDHHAVVTVKFAVVWGFALLIPAMMATGISGGRLARGWNPGHVAIKLRRLQIVAANGILVLAPAAIFLALRAQSGHFDSLFYSVQAVELTAGLLNITLLVRNMRDGRRLAGAA